MGADHPERKGEMTAHTEFRKGSSVFVQMKDGAKFSDKYDSKKANYVFLRNRGKVVASEIRAMSFDKKTSTVTER